MRRNIYRKAQNGAALLTVLIAMMIISIMLFEFQYNCMVERKLAYNDLNQTQAYYLAKSGIRIGLLRVALYGRLRKSPELKSLAGTVGNITPYLERIWQIPLPSFPPATKSIAKLEKADRDAAEKVLTETKIKEGGFTHVITSEGSKINLNYLQVPQANINDRINFQDIPKRLDQYVGRTLVNLLDGFLKDSEKPYEEYPSLRPEEQVMDIMDWVNPGNTRFAGGDKDTFYQQQKPSYKAKRNRFYSVDELRLVRGIDNHLFNKLKSHVTVYSYDGKINLNSANTELYRALYRDFTEDDLKRLMAERERLGGWPDVKSFVTFITSGLGRNGFTTYYPDDKNYPFTVGTMSFIIESLGMITKSNSSVQKVIRVAVALTQAKASGGQPITNIVDPNQCAGTKNAFWDKRDLKCKQKATNLSECQFLGATWMQDPATSKYGCKINNEPIIFPDTAGTGAAGQQDDPNAMKILYWSES